MNPYWSGVFPAITTQMHKDGSLDLDATAHHAEVLIKSGVSGLILYLRNWHALGLLLVGVYAAFGFDGLIHYSRASFAEHSVAINLTIWFEVVAAGALMVVVVTSAIRRCLAGQAI